MFSRDHDPKKKRWNLKLDVLDEERQCLTMGIMTESKTTSALKLQTMVDKRVSCIAKNYILDDETRACLNLMHKQGTVSFEAPNEPLDPVFIQKTGP